MQRGDDTGKMYSIEDADPEVCLEPPRNRQQIRKKKGRRRPASGIGSKQL